MYIPMQFLHCNITSLSTTKNDYDDSGDDVNLTSFFLSININQHHLNLPTTSPIYFFITYTWFIAAQLLLLTSV